MKKFEKKIIRLKQQYSVKGVKYFRGCEGYGFNATLYLAKKRISFVYDSGNGEVIYHFEPFNLDAFGVLKKACKDVGRVPYSYLGYDDMIAKDTQYTIETLVDALLAEYDQKKLLKKKVYKN